MFKVREKKDKKSFEHFKLTLLLLKSIIITVTVLLLEHINLEKNISNNFLIAVLATFCIFIFILLVCLQIEFWSLMCREEISRIYNRVWSKCQLESGGVYVPIEEGEIKDYHLRITIASAAVEKEANAINYVPVLLALGSFAAAVLGMVSKVGSKSCDDYEVMNCFILLIIVILFELIFYYIDCQRITSLKYAVRDCAIKDFMQKMKEDHNSGCGNDRNW